MPESAKIDYINAGKHYCYAIDSEKNDVYSWGLGEQYVLGNRDDVNQFEPFKVHPKMFYEENVRHIGCGD